MGVDRRVRLCLALPARDAFLFGTRRRPVDPRGCGRTAFSSLGAVIQTRNLQGEPR